MISVRTSIATVGILATTLALTGCASAYISVESPQGIGVCGADPLTLTVTQNTAGDEVVIDYNGPSDVSLVAYQGFYSDTRFWGQAASESVIFNYPVEDSDAPHDYALNALNFESAPWTLTSMSASTISAVFDGSVNSLVDGFVYNVAESEPELAYFDKLFPVTIAVICEEDVPSLLLPGPSVDMDGVIESFEVAVAQPLFPNFMYVDAPNVTRQRAIDNGIRGRMELPADIVDALPDAIGDIGMDVTLAYLGEDDPYAPLSGEDDFTLDGASLGDLWLLTLEGMFMGAGSTTFEVVGDQSLTEPFTFEFTADTEPEDGYYLFNFVVGDAGENPEYLKMSTAVLRYSSAQGLTLSGLDEPPVVDKLATTGSDPNAIIWAALGGLVVLAAVFLRPKRRKAQADSTNVPSDLK
jgi:hypothetical protein